MKPEATMLGPTFGMTRDHSFRGGARRLLFARNDLDFVSDADFDQARRSEQPLELASYAVRPTVVASPAQKGPVALTGFPWWLGNPAAAGISVVEDHDPSHGFGRPTLFPDRSPWIDDPLRDATRSNPIEVLLVIEIQDVAFPEA